MRINHMIAYFKVGQKGTTWFNFCTSVDVDEAARDQAYSLHSNAHLKAKGSSFSDTFDTMKSSFGRKQSHITDVSHQNADRHTPRTGPSSSAAVKGAEGFALDDAQAVDRAGGVCSLCRVSKAENECTYSTLMRAMCIWQSR